ncbi:MAG: ATP-binding protein [Fibrobacteres bacterium]|nr:ATP-binding protein [Fibrobacterota bacterium]
MRRHIFSSLLSWKNDPDRKPLLIRGARQVGKTFIIRELSRTFNHNIEINFDLQPELKSLFEKDLDVNRICKDLTLLYQQQIIPGKTLIFFDEIQEAPRAIAALRYFYEIMPDLHVIAAGSLLEFAIEEIGIPVGRVTSFYMYPLSFMEFLAAQNEGGLVRAIVEHNVNEPFPQAVHSKLITMLGRYFVVGGMPEAVKSWVEKTDASKITAIHNSLIQSFRQDFTKYGKKHQIKYLDLIFNAIPPALGERFRYHTVPGGFRKRELSVAFDMLVKAGIADKITQAGGRGIPIGADADPEHFKGLFLDLGLAQNMLQVDIAEWVIDTAAAIINRGAITEFFVGRELMAYSSPDRRAELYYWQKNGSEGSAEIDFLMSRNGLVCPVEVKSSAAGHMKSMKRFLESRPGCGKGIRFWGGPFEQGEWVDSFPLYAVASVVPNASKLLENLFTPVRPTLQE